jgi:hypothetical protein
MTYCSPEGRVKPVSASIFTLIRILHTLLNRVRNNNGRFPCVSYSKDSLLNVRCTLRMRFCATFILSLKTLSCILRHLRFKVWQDCVISGFKPEDRTLRLSSVTFLSLLVFYFALRLSKTHAHMPAFFLHCPRRNGNRRLFRTSVSIFRFTLHCTDLKRVLNKDCAIPMCFPL